MSVDFRIINGPKIKTLKQDKNLILTISDNPDNLSVLEFINPNPSIDENTNMPIKNRIGIYDKVLLDDDYLHYAKYPFGDDVIPLFQYLYDTYETMFLDDVTSNQQEYMEILNTSLDDKGITDDDIISYEKFFLSDAMLRAGIKSDKLQKIYEDNKNAYDKTKKAFNQYLKDDKKKYQETKQYSLQNNVSKSLQNNVSKNDPIDGDPLDLPF